MRTKLYEIPEGYKITIIAILLTVFLCLTFYAHLIFKTGIIFTHFFYIPIILSSIWWKRKGLVVAACLGGVVILSSSIFLEADLINNFLRASMFVLISFVVAILSERIAEREGALRESEEKYRAFFQTSKAFVFITSADGRLVDFNDAVIELLGYENRDELQKVGVPELYEHPEERKEHLQLVQEQGHYPVNLRKKDGSIINTLISTVARKDEDGHVTVFQGIATDITEHKLVEEALQQHMHTLDERVRELNCLYSISSLAERPNILLEEILQGIVEIIPPAGQYPEITCAQIIVGEKEFKTANFRETKWRLLSDIIVSGESIGSVEVCCLEERPERYEEGFLLEERNLINAVAEQVGRIVQRTQTEEELRKHRDHLEAMVEERTIELRKINQQLQQKIIENKKAKEALLASREYARNLIESSLDMVISVDVDRNIVEFNKAAEETFGYGRSEVTGNPVDILYANPEESFEVHNTTLGDGKCVREIQNRRKNGETFPTFLSASLLRGVNGKVMGIMGVSRDITELKRSQEQIGTSLKEKETLLAEIHHRVKNNLQIISSLLDMRIMRADNQQVIALLEDARSKIHTMAMIHSQLYQSEQFGRIEMKRHITELANYLSQIYATGKRINTIVESNEVYLSLNRAIPCALVINELASNALRHAFKGRDEGSMEISLQETKDGKIILTVKDDGVGIPEDIDIFKTDTLGLKLVTNTVKKQLKGELKVERDAGTTIIAEFSIMEEGKIYHA